MGISGNWDYYEILDVPRHASLAEIQKGYQKARNTYSLTNPEIFKIFSKQEAMAWLQLVEEAYRVLGHPRTREVYNLELLGKGRVAPTDLPSFVSEEPVMPQANINGQVQQATAERESLVVEESREFDDYHGQTSLSVYQIDPAIEDLIGKQDVFDGLFLKKIRQYKNVDIQDFSNKTCIALRHLYAIENNNFAVLPAAVFVRGYIIQYCRILNLEETKVVPSFMSLLANEVQPRI